MTVSRAKIGRVVAARVAQTARMAVRALAVRVAPLCLSGRPRVPILARQGSQLFILGMKNMKNFPVFHNENPSEGENLFYSLTDFSRKRP
jgi:hypothetical protein